MDQDETEFDKLLRETREWEARDRQRHKSVAMADDRPSEFPRPSPPKAPSVTVEDILGRSTKPVSSPKPASTPPATPAGVTMSDFKAAFKAAAKATEAQRTAGRRGKASPWGWIWAILILFFLIRHFAR
jgi:hypothetical protein